MALAAASRRASGRALAGGSELLAVIERRLGLTASGLTVVAMAVGGFALARFIVSQALVLLVYGVVLVVLVAYGMGRRRLQVEADRSDLPTRVREGQVVDVDLRLTARRGVSTVVLEEVLDEQLGRTVRVPVPNLPGGHTVEHRYSFSPKLRGVYEVGPLTATWSDPFGLTRHRMRLCEPARLIVHPRVEQVHDRVIAREWEDPPVRPPVSRPWPTGFEFYGMRDYVLGDDPRRVVWRATAKTLDTETGEGRYLVRESEQGITDQVALLIDTDAERHSPGHPSDTFETAVRVAASLGVRHLRDGFTVSLETNATKLLSDLRGRRCEITLLDRLAATGQEVATSAEALDRLLARRRRTTHDVFITPHLDQKTAARLQLMLQRGTSMLVVLVMWDGSDPLSAHRAGGLGCPVVEVRAGVAMDRVFQNAVGSRRR